MNKYEKITDPSLLAAFDYLDPKTLLKVFGNVHTTFTPNIHIISCKILNYILGNMNAAFSKLNLRSKKAKKIKNKFLRSSSFKDLLYACSDLNTDTKLSEREKIVFELIRRFKNDERMSEYVHAIPKNDYSSEEDEEITAIWLAFRELISDVREQFGASIKEQQEEINSYEQEGITQVYFGFLQDLIGAVRNNVPMKNLLPFLFRTLGSVTNTPIPELLSYVEVQEIE